MKRGFDLKSKSGFTLIEVVIALGVAMVLFLGVMQMQASMQKGQTQSNVTFQADTVHRNLVTLARNVTAWTNTIAGPLNASAKLQCLAAGTPCTKTGAAAGPPITNQVIPAIYNANTFPGTVFYDSTNPAAGFTQQGAPCTGFVAPPGTGNDACPLRYDMSWSAICGASCINPQVQLNFTATYNPKSNALKIAFNPANYSSSSIYGNALLINGTGGSINCTTVFAGPLPASNVDAVCPAGFVVTGGGCWSGSPGTDNIALGAPYHATDPLTNPAGASTGGAGSPPAANTAPAAGGVANAWHCYTNDNTSSAYAVCCQ